MTDIKMATFTNIDSVKCSVSAKQKSLLPKVFEYGDIVFKNKDETKVLFILENVNVTISKIQQNPNTINTKVTFSCKVTSKGWRSGSARGEDAPPTCYISIYSGYEDKKCTGQIENWITPSIFITCNSVSKPFFQDKLFSYDFYEDANCVGIHFDSTNVYPCK